MNVIAKMYEEREKDSKRERKREADFIALTTLMYHEQNLRRGVSGLKASYLQIPLKLNSPSPTHPPKSNLF
jgi:hypothetical protein